MVKINLNGLTPIKEAKYLDKSVRYNEDTTAKIVKWINWGWTAFAKMERLVVLYSALQT